MCGHSVNHSGLNGPMHPPHPPLFCFGFLILACVPRNALAQWSALAESKVSYTNDVTNFSAARRLKFSEDPSQPTGLPTQLSDVIWDPSLEVIRSSSLSLGPNELSVKAHGCIFTNNPIFNHGEYRLQFRCLFSWTRWFWDGFQAFCSAPSYSDVRRGSSHPRSGSLALAATQRSGSSRAL